jgi:hypothetical protein
VNHSSTPSTTVCPTCRLGYCQSCEKRVQNAMICPTCFNLCIMADDYANLEDRERRRVRSLVDDIGTIVGYPLRDPLGFVVLAVFIGLFGFAAKFAAFGRSTDDHRVSARVTPGREVVLVGGGASFDTRASFIDGELIFWRHEDRTKVLAAFLDKPFGVSHAPRLIEPPDHPYAFTAAADATGRICLAGLRYDEGGRSTITASISEDRAVSWSQPQLVHREEGELLIFDSDPLVSGRPGEWYLLVRYRLGRAPKGQLFSVYRFWANQWVLRGFVPGTDDLSVSDWASLGVSNDGRLAVAFITYAGALRVLESADGGQTWVTLGAPARLSVPGIRIPFLNPPFVAEPPRVTESMPSLRWTAGGWGLVWETHVSILRGVLMTWDNYVDTLFARYDRAARKWTATARISDRRTMIRTTVPPMGGGGMHVLEMVHRERRGTDLRQPQLASAASGRLAIFWSELRDGRIQPVASVSNDGGASWSRIVVLEGPRGGDSETVRGTFDEDGNLRAVYLTWPGKTTLLAPNNVGLKASESLLR